MKTLTIYITFLSIFAASSLDMFAYFPDLKKNKNIVKIISSAIIIVDSEPKSEDRIIELKELRSGNTVSFEEEIQIEDWMTSKFSGLMNVEKTVEQELVIEDWMTNNLDFTIPAGSSDPELEIEPWMGEIIK